jgi:histone-lysine N-methyltransferase SETMAR
MEKSEFRVLIKYYFLRKKTITEVKAKLDKHFPDTSPSFGMIHKWFTEFRCGRASTEDAERPGRPNEVTTPEMINKIHDIVLNDPKVKVREIAEIVSISTERVLNILHEHLAMKKLCARWVPRVLTIDQKRIRVTTSERNLAYINRNPKEFLRRFVTMDETWIHHYTPESKQQSKQWVGAHGSAPKRPRTQQTAGKVMASVFWDANGVIFIDYLEKGKTITGAYYAALLDRLVDELKKKRPHLAKKKVLFHDDNAPSHTSNIGKAKKHELGFESFDQPPYSPDLAPSDYYLFPNLKRWLCGKRFESNEEVEWETDAYFGRLDKSYYLKGIEKLTDRYTRCIELKGEYVEK